MDPDLFDEEEALVKKPRPIGWFVAGAVTIVAGTLFAAYYLPLQSAHSKLVSEHGALAKKAAELDHWLKADRAQLAASEGRRAALQKFVDTAATTDKERLGRLEIVQTTVERELGPFLKSKLLTIETDPDALHLSFQEKALFRPGTSTPSAGARNTLCKSVSGLMGAKDVTVEVETRTAQDDTKYWETATERAQALAKILDGNCSFPAHKIRVTADHSAPKEEGSAPSIDVHLRLDRDKEFSPSDAPASTADTPAE